jgi:carboxymethylenebutenolidase
MAIPVSTQMVTTGSGMPVYVATPSGPGPFPCVLVLHERYGLVQHTIDLADKLADAGYLAAAPDLFFDAPDQDALHRGDVRVEPHDDDVARHLRSVIAALDDRPEADGTRVGIIGACQTGRYSFVLGSHFPIRACGVFYGATSGWDVTDKRPVSLEKLMSEVDAPVFAVFGELDHTISVPDVQRLRNTLEKFDKSYHIMVCADAPHGFLNSTMPGRYRPEATAAVWRNLLSYLDANLASSAAASPGEPRITWTFECSKHTGYDFAKNVRRE